ncbi:MAG: hypothetical protein U0R66_07540 [Mycobacterium sp.]
MDAAAEALPGRARDGPALERPARPPRRAGGDVAVPAGSLADWSLVEPAEPVVSAYASGIAVIAVPMPSATASAPTRPTWLANERLTPPEVSRDEETFDGTLTSPQSARNRSVART